MPVYCSIPNCPSKRGRQYKTSFQIPSNPEQAKRWIDSIKSAFKYFEPIKRSRICSLHFKKEDIYNTDTIHPKLQFNAVPSIFQPMAEEEQMAFAIREKKGLRKRRAKSPLEKESSLPSIPISIVIPECPTCGQAFQEPRELYTHRYLEHDEFRRSEKVSELVWSMRMSETLYSSESECEYEVEVVVEKRERAKEEAQNDFVCSFCEANFSTIEDLLGHYEKLHNVRDVVLFTSDQINLKVKKTQTRVCAFCGHISRLTADALRHVRTHLEPDRTKDFLCADCGKQFEKLVYLRLHQQNVDCKARAEADRLLQHVERIEVDDADLTLFRCRICQATLTTLPKIRQHIISQHKVGDQIATRSFESNEETPGTTMVPKMNEDQDEDSAEPRICFICRKPFNSLTTLKSHFSSKHGSTHVYQCESCLSTFQYAFDLRHHVCTGDTLES